MQPSEYSAQTPAAIERYVGAARDVQEQSMTEAAGAIALRLAEFLGPVFVALAGRR